MAENELGPFDPDLENGPTEEDEEEVLQELYGKARRNGLYVGPERGDPEMLLAASSAQSLIDEARKYIGVEGRPNGFTKWYSNDRKHGSAFLRAPWCDIFVTYCAFFSNTYNAVCPSGDRAYTVWHAQDFQKLIKTTVPAVGHIVNWLQSPHTPWVVGTASGVNSAEPGWIVFFDWGGSNQVGKIDHIGIVEKNLGGGRVQTIEGNTSDSVRRRVRSTGHIVGFGVPAYVAVSDPKPSNKPTVPSGKPFLKVGSKGTRVRQLQQCLHYLGARFPKYGIDGEYGNETKGNVKLFQKQVKLSQDGIYGPLTESKLRRKVVEK